MKKLAFSLLWGTTLLLAACGNNQTPPTPPVVTTGTELQTASPTPSTYAYTRTMQKPDITEMTNRTAMTEGYQTERSTDYTVKVENTERFLERCFQNPARWGETPKLITDDSRFYKELKESDIVSWNVLTLTGYRDSEAFLTLSPDQKNQVAKRGRTLIELQQLKNPRHFDYSKESSDAEGFMEERATLYQRLGGDQYNTRRRHPFNTLLVTNDLLLHVYHKLFDNGLKYYEEQIARPTMATLSEKLYNQYVQLSKDNTPLKSTYEFLAAYWAVPQIFLPSNQELITFAQNNSAEGDGDIDDKQLETLLRQRIKTITKSLAPTYQTLIPQVVEKILKADEGKSTDEFLLTFDGKVLTANGITLEQDYTQFKPRAHYTDSSLLKTYFVAMKWLMREKFYFSSRGLTEAAFVMVNTIKDEDLQQLNQLSDQITNLIGADDDVTLNEMKSFLQQYAVETEVNSIPQERMNFLREKLTELHPQKIQSTPYTTDMPAATTEAESKKITDGFVFFGEKFTLDSYLFDLTTAGSAEKEFAYKPNKQTALIVPDLLEENALANQLVHLRLQEKAAQEQILEDNEHTQASSYDTVRTAAKEKLAEVMQEGSTITANIYHKRLQMLGRLLQAPLENAPYRYQDPLYQFKNLITYLGSYTELKHDTLLYVKQSYAEMGAGGGDDCNLYVEMPIPPQPKGYVEVEPDFLDQLISLNAETLPYFSGTYEKAKFVEFATILEKLKEISIKQMQNTLVSDEDFEWMRLLGGKLHGIVIATKTLWISSQKEMRGALIADIFTSEGGNPLYEAIGRPALMLLMVNDVNGARVVLWPVFTHYEFYQGDNVLPSDGSRYTDEDWQDKFDEVSTQRPTSALSIVSRELKKALEKAE